MHRLSILLLCPILAMVPGSSAQEALLTGVSSSVPQFTNISAAAGIGGIPEHGGHAILFADVNGDGREDIYVTHTNFNPGGGGFLALPDELFINNGNNTFTEIALAAGVNDPGQSHGAVFVDIDNDGDLDLFNGQRGPSGNRLYRNLGSGIFDEITEEAGIIPTDRRTISVLAIDIDRDGDVDLFSGNWGETNEMYVNDGTGHFTIEDRGVEDVDDPEEIGTMAATAADVDNDGDLDIFLAKREDTCRLYINNGAGYFTDQAKTRGVAHLGLSAGAVFVDIDRDADLDMLLATLASPVPGDGMLTKLRVYRNQGDGTFVDETDMHNIPFSGYTVNAGDFNNDGHPDIFLAINFGMSSLWLNDGTGHFVKQSNTGLERNGLDARATTLADIDNDGDLDITITHIEEPTILYRNDLNAAGTAAQNYLQVDLALPNGNAAPFGAKVYLYKAGHLDEPAYLRGYQQLAPTQGTLSQNSPIVHFGLEPNCNYDVRVRHLDGSTSVLTNVAPGQRINPGAGVDTTPPVIGSIAANPDLPTRADITWTTDEPATSQVEYGTTPTLGTFTIANPSLTQSHSEQLSNLTAGITYYFCVISADAAGNTARSDTLAFTTPLPDVTAPIISNVSFANLQPASARIRWNTDEPATSQVEYGVTTAYGMITPLTTALVTSHEVLLSGLQSNTLYHFRVRSRDAQGNEAISGDFQFLTPIGPVLWDDFNGPALDTEKWQRGNHPNNAATVENGALHLRTTASSTSGWVYTRDKFTARDKTIQLKVVQPNGDGALGMSPTVNPSATNGFYGEPNWYRFYNYRNGPGEPYKLYVQWRKNNLVDGLDVATGASFTNNFYLRLRTHENVIFFEYSFDNANWSTAYSETFALPGYTLADLFAFEFSAYSTPTKGEWVVDDFSLDSTLAPPVDGTPPVISQVEVVDIQQNSARIRWNTNEPATSQVEYGLNTNYGTLTPIDNALATAHELLLAVLEPGLIYHFRVRSSDAHGNEAVSDDFQFTTLASVLFNDNFNGASLDLGKWIKGSHPRNNTVVENGALHLRSTGRTSGWAYTREKFRGRNRTVQIKVVLPNEDGALGISPTADSTAENGFYDEPNWYRFYNYSEGNKEAYKLYVQWRKNNVVDGLDVALDGRFIGDFYLRLRMDEAHIAFEYSYEGSIWITAYSEPFALPGYTVDDFFACELSAYHTAAKGEWVLDDFIINANTSAIVSFEGETVAQARLKKTNLPQEFALSQSYPSPFHFATHVNLNLPESGRVRAVIFNLQGQQVAHLREGYLLAGSHFLRWNGTNDTGTALSSGVYFLKVLFEGEFGAQETSTRRLVLVK